MWLPNMGVTHDSAAIYWGYAGLKHFELTNHLGNVLGAISDKMLPGLTAEVLSEQDYYPFGMLEPDRSSGLENYRYGFNGKENDNEVKGEGNQQDYGMRVYDPRLGRFLSVDPLAHDYPWNSVYAYAENSPTLNIDLDGLEKISANNTLFKFEFIPQITPTTKEGIRKILTESAKSAARSPTVKKVILSSGARLLASAGPSVILTGILVLIPQGIGNPEGGKWWQEYQKKKIQASYEEFKDPSQLSDEYLKGVAQRIKDGTASAQDYQYQDEIIKRAKEGRTSGETGNDSKPTFTKLIDKEIRALQDLFSDGDPKFIEKLKTGSGSGAGKLDLYKEDQTGYIYIKPKGHPELPGEKTEYNVSQLK